MDMRSPVLGKHAISAPALYAARVLLQNYEFRPIPGAIMAQYPVDELHVALVVDLCTAVYRLAPLIPQAKHWYQALKEGRASPEQLEHFLAELVSVLRYMPSYSGGAFVLNP